MRLHYHPRSTFSQRARIALHEKGIEVELKPIDVAGKELRTPAYLALNPYGRIPTLVDGDFVLYESTAILEYLEALHPTPPLLPPDPRGRARVAMHMKLCDLEIGVHTRGLIFPSRFVEESRWDQVTMQAAREKIDAHLGLVSVALGEHPFLAGDDYTLADVCYTPFVRFLDELRLHPPPAVRQWAALLLSRPSVRACWLDR